jgi:hypothetical protein
VGGNCREKQSLCVKWRSERKKNTHVCNWLTFFWVYRHCNRFFQLLLHHPRSTKTLILIFSRVCVSLDFLYLRDATTTTSAEEEEEWHFPSVCGKGTP